MTPTEPGSSPRSSGNRPLSLDALADLLGSPVGAAPSTASPVQGVTLASAEVRPGDLYAALPGARTHGARYAADAAARGAVAILTDPTGRAEAMATGLPVCVVDDPRAVLGTVADRVYGEPSRQLTVLGITGTNGKTTTAYLVEAGLAAARRGTGLIGTVQTRTRIRDADGRETVTEVPSVRTTPEAPALHALLASMADDGVSAVVMEVSSHALVLGRVGGIRFAVAGFTNLGRDHLDFHRDLEEYFGAKALLFDGRADRELVTIDDEAGRRLAALRPEAGTVSIRGTADWWAADVAAAPAGGSTFTLHGPGGRTWPARLRLPGRFNVANAILAVALLDAVGVRVESALAGLAETVVPGRMEPVDAGQPFVAVVDYAHTPDAVSTALAALRDATAGRLLTVLGCGGDRDPGKRAAMGAAAAEGSDVLVVTDDNPRSEDPSAIRAAMLRGVREVPEARRAEVHEVAGRRDAVATAVALARPGDTLLVAGKGHETGQEIAGTVHPFDDRDVLREVLAGVGDAGMIALSLAEVAALVDGELTGGPATVTGKVTLDSRAVVPGDLFVAVAGERVDGHDFLGAAADAGAVAALCTRPDSALPCVVVPDPVVALGRLAAGVHVRLTAGGLTTAPGASQRGTSEERTGARSQAGGQGLRTLAITGSSGKTSTKDLLGQVLAAGGPTVSPPGSYNNDIGLPLTVLDADEATRFLVLEMGSRGPGHIARLCGVARPQIGVVLNVGSAHLGEFGSADGIARAKGELVEALPDDGTAVLNADDPRVLGMAARTRARVLTTGLGEDADVRATGVGLDGSARARFTLVAAGEEHPVALQVVGQHQVANALSAAGAALAAGLEPAVIAAALSTAGSRSRWRMEVERRPDGVTVVNDAYNANPESMRAALAALAGLAGERRIAVLGAMAELGPDAAAEHERLGRDAVAAGVDLLVAVGPDAVGIAHGASAAGLCTGSGAGEESVHVPDRAAARELLSGLLRPGDVVLVKASRSYGLELLAADLLDAGAGE